MADTPTLLANVFKPQILGEVVNRSLIKNTPLLNSPYVDNQTETALWQDGGNTVTVQIVEGDPTQGVVDVPADGTEIESSGITVTPVTFAVRKRTLNMAFHVDVLEEASRKAAVYNQIVSHIGMAVSHDIHSYFVDRLAAATTLQHNITGAVTKTINPSAINKAKLKWKDKAQQVRAGLLVHSSQYGDLLELDELKLAGSHATGMLSTVTTGQVPMIAGMPIYVTDACPETATGTVEAPTTDYTAFLVAERAIGFAMKKEVTIEPMRRPRTFMVDTLVRFDYLAYVRPTNPPPSVILKTR